MSRPNSFLGSRSGVSGLSDKRVGDTSPERIKIQKVAEKWNNLKATADREKREKYEIIEDNLKYLEKKMLEDGSYDEIYNVLWPPPPISSSS